MGHIEAPATDTPNEDNEQFCPDCFAGLESSEHHEKCVAPLDAEWDEVWRLKCIRPGGDA